jgi:hypothetical protein
MAKLSALGTNSTPIGSKSATGWAAPAKERYTVTPPVEPHTVIDSSNFRMPFMQMIALSRISASSSGLYLLRSNMRLLPSWQIEIALLIGVRTSFFAGEWLTQSQT